MLNQGRRQARTTFCSMEKEKRELSRIGGGKDYQVILRI
jgi:hypothetical protein